jgi:hypothetical protein
LTVGNVETNPDPVIGGNGDFSVRGCFATVTIHAGRIGRDLSVVGSIDNAVVDITTQGGARSVGVNNIGSNPPVISNLDLHVQAGNYRTLFVVNTAASKVRIDGTLRTTTSDALAINVAGNTNLQLGQVVGDDLSNVDIKATTFASAPQFTVGNVLNTFGHGSVTINGNTGLPLTSLGIGNRIDSTLTITNNHGFTDQEATAFGQQHSVGGAVTISGNTNP